MLNPKYNEEIGLIDFIQIINKRKTFILSTALVAMVLASIIIFIIPKTYEVKATIQNGYINVPIITYPEASTLIRSGLFLNPIFEKIGLRIPQEHEIKKMILLENIKESNLFMLKVRLKDNDIAYSLCKEIVSVYIEYGNSNYNRQTDLIRNQIYQVENLIEKTKLSADKNALAKRENVSPLAYPDDKVQIRDLLFQKFQLETQLVVNKEFKLIDGPVKSKYPVSPKKVPIIVFSCFVALMAGISYALLAENWEKTKPGR
ncbi:MAG: Wzz/FepE/Etk N-terminal domain-containing protein [bacterium]